MRPRVLVIDDKPNIIKLVRDVLDGEFVTTAADDGVHAIAQLSIAPFDVIVSDLMMPGADGMMVLREARATQPDAEVILMTAFGTVDTAVEAMKLGAYDYITKPFDPEELLLRVRRAAERKQLKQQSRDLQTALDGTRRLDNLVARSQPMQRVLELVQRVAATEATVLITGESGTGKEVVARAVHAASARRMARFVAINCGAIPENLIEAELFGHGKGAFTGAVAARPGLFEDADGGTIFLDELGELPLAMQVKLNRVLQERSVRRVGATDERPVDVRVVAATNVDLKAAVTAGRFREDLYYRLNVFPLHIPPLRERREDIVPLVALFHERYARKGEAPEGFAAEVLAALLEHDWPGNVRELENVVRRALAICDKPQIGLECLPAELVTAPHASGKRLEHLSYRDMLLISRERATREYLIAVLEDVHGNVSQAAERAHIERESMYRLLKRFGLKPDDYKQKD